MYPVGTSHRAAYVAASSGAAPPGAHAPMTAEFWDIEAADGLRGTTSLDRFPNGVPAAPGSFDYATTTFEQRQQARAEEWSTWSLPHPEWGEPINTIRGRWDQIYGWGCEFMAIQRELDADDHSGAGTPTTSCEWHTDWDFWMCRVFNEPAVKQMTPFDQWKELAFRYWDTVVELVGRDTFSDSAVDLYEGILSQATDRLMDEWSDNPASYCSMRIDNQENDENRAYHAAQVAELHAEMLARYGRDADWAGNAMSYLGDSEWLDANPWLADRRAAQRARTSGQ